MLSAGYLRAIKPMRMSQQPHLKLLELEAENARLKKELLAATHKLQTTEEKIIKTESKIIKLQDAMVETATLWS